jgi:hypothetical protein
LRTYFETSVVSYLVRAREKEGYKEKIETIEQLIQEGLIEPVTSIITEDEAEELKKDDVRGYLTRFKIVQSSIMVFPIKLGRDRFGNDYTHGLYDEYFEGEIKPSNPLDREDAFHYVNILDRKNKIELVISGDKKLVKKLKTKHSKLQTLYFHDAHFSNELLKTIRERK